MLLLNLSLALSGAVDAGLLEPKVRRKALKLAEASARKARTSSQRGHCLDTVATAIGEAVRSGTIPPDRLAEAVAAHRTAVSLTPGTHPYWPQRTSNLATRIAQAVGTGAASATELLEAIALQRAALDRAPSGHPDRAGSFEDRCEISGRCMPDQLPRHPAWNERGHVCAPHHPLPSGVQAPPWSKRCADDSGDYANDTGACLNTGSSTSPP
ncbi:hypothetical protein GCM10022235_00390 [Kribbella ginsengisoli]|uniref:DUF222 domain-containing protein n=1 Tax=Kribbella ginsengisoli TaxID=363865 RepID=A0ABP6VMU0_9ACTN